MKANDTLIGIQESYIETINAGIERWAHRPGTTYRPHGGHAERIARGARTAATQRLNRLGFTDQKQIDAILKDARDMAALIRNSKDDAI